MPSKAIVPVDMPDYLRGLAVDRPDDLTFGFRRPAPRSRCPGAE